LIRQSVAACFRDGTSNTWIVGEQSGAVNGVDLRNRYYSPWGGVSQPAPISLIPQGVSLWGMGLTCVTMPINSNVTNATCDDVWDGSTILNSFHPGGVNMLSTDGAVRFVTDGTNFANFQAMCVRNDGVLTSDP